MSNIENFKIMQGILDADNEPTVPAPLDPDVIASFRFTETPEQEMINEYKEGKKYNSFKIDAWNSPEINGYPKYGRSTDPNFPDEIFAKDPEKNTDNFAFVTICEDPSEIPKASETFKLEDESFETPEEINRYLREHLIHTFKRDVDKDNLDEIAVQTAELDMQLKQFTGVKIDKFIDLNLSLQEAQRILNLERQSQLLKILKDLVKRGPYNEFDDNCDKYYESLSTLDPDDQKAFREANSKFQQAVTILEDPSVNLSSKSALNAELNIRNLVLDALTLWPNYNQDERANQIVYQILNLTDVERSLPN